MTKLHVYAAALLAVAFLLAMPAAAADGGTNAAGLPLLTPAKGTFAGNLTYYYEIPNNPVGLLVMLHRCGRNGEDAWPPSPACPECLGMPEAVSISRQALARGYALLAPNSANRTLGSGGKCWSLTKDAEAVRELVLGFRRQHVLEQRPLFFTGCSSGGSLALRLPIFMHMDGIMPVAIGLDMDAFPPTLPEELNHVYPPVAYMHFARDNDTTQQIDAMVAASRERGLETAQMKVPPRAIDPDYFSRRDAMISLELSRRIQAMLKDNMSALDSSNVPTDDFWDRTGDDFRDTTMELIETYLEEELVQQAQQAQQAQQGSPVNLTIGGTNGTDSDYAGSAAGGNNRSAAGGDAVDFWTVLNYYSHVTEQLGVSYAEHTNYGDLTTAVLIWLERCGNANFSELASRYRVTTPATLSPVRTASEADVLQPWLACRPPLAPPAGAPTGAPAGAVATEAGQAGAPAAQPAAAAASADDPKPQAGAQAPLPVQLPRSSGAARSLWSGGMLVAAALAALFASCV